MSQDIRHFSRTHTAVILSLQHFERKNFLCFFFFRVDTHVLACLRLRLCVRLYLVRKLNPTIVVRFSQYLLTHPFGFRWRCPGIAAATAVGAFLLRFWDVHERTNCRRQFICCGISSWQCRRKLESERTRRPWPGRDLWLRNRWIV